MPGDVRDLSVQSEREVPRRRSPRDRAEALLTAIESVQQRTDLFQLAERAALSALSLAAATAAGVYLESAEAMPQLAFAGQAHDPAEVANALRDLVASGNADPYVLVAGATTVAAPFRAGNLRGAVLAERKGSPFDDEDGRTLAQFAGHVGNAAASLLQMERTSRVELIGQAVLDALGEGVLIAVDGRIKVINRSAARILDIVPEAALSSPLQGRWPEVAALVDAGQPVEDRRVRAGGQHLVVSFLPIPTSNHRVALIRFVEAEGSDSPPRRPPPKQALFGLDDLVGRSDAVAAIRDFVLVATQSGSSVVIEGESGS